MGEIASPVVYLSAGCSVRGTRAPAVGEGVPVECFLGIPFAEPPVGVLRFSRPQSKKLWTGEKVCTEFGPICPQKMAKTSESHQPFLLNLVTSEDCLHLNVWTPYSDRPTRDPLPVIVFIYGGGYFEGLSDIYDGTAYASLENIVFVSFNYRIGAFGFFSTGDDSALGNYGLWDQVEALKWVQRHIAVFGGNPDNVTIMGESAGGMSASLHTLSNASKGLFRRAICQSGVAPSPYATKSLQAARGTLSSHGYDVTDTKEVVSSLRSKTADELIDIFPGPSFKPVIDGDFLVDHPISLYANGMFQEVDLLLGMNTHEGHVILQHYLSDDNQGPVTPTRENVRDYVKGIVKLCYSPLLVESVTEKLMEVYVTANVLESKDLLAEAVTHVCGDCLFVAPNMYVASKHSERTKTYLYLFSHRVSFSTNPEWVVTDHGEDLFYSMGVPFLPYLVSNVNFTDEDRELSKAMMDTFANFAKNGYPSTDSVKEWPEYNNNTKYYIDFSKDIQTRQKYKQNLMDFWMRHTEQWMIGGKETI